MAPIKNLKEHLRLGQNPIKQHNDTIIDSQQLNVYRGNEPHKKKNQFKESIFF